MRTKTAVLTAAFLLSCLALTNPPSLASGLQPVHKAIGASCITGFHASPQTYDSLDAGAHYMCYGPPPVCAPNMAVWWEQPPGVAAGPRFQYSCKVISVGAPAAINAQCAAGFSAVYFRPGQSLDPNVKYSCASATVECPAVFTINSSDPDYYGWKSGSWMYRCNKTA